MVLPHALSAKFKETFAYETIKDRLPIILTKVVDTTFRQKHEIKGRLGEEGELDLKAALGQLSEMRYRLATDKQLVKLKGTAHDIESWNGYLGEFWKEADPGQPNEKTDLPSWFKSPWLLVECYLYRKIAEVFENSKHLRDWDPFQFQKEQAFISSLPSMKILGDYMVENILVDEPSYDKKEILEELMQISLWGNKFDLSISAGEQHAGHHYHSPLIHVKDNQNNIVVNDLEKVVAFLLDKTHVESSRRVDFILDNAGMELFGDLCLAEFLLSSGVATTILFHVKPIPWFVSDTTLHDFGWTLEMLRASNVTSLNKLGHLWHKREAEGFFAITTDPFWVSGRPFYMMKDNAPQLHQELLKSTMLIFKGDLNYRKLLSDLDWPCDTNFISSLCGFNPGPFVSLRTLKADLVSGMDKQLFEKLESQFQRKWMVSGDYAVVQTNL